MPVSLLDGIPALDPLFIAPNEREDILDPGFLEYQRHTGARLFGQSTAVATISRFSPLSFAAPSGVESSSGVISTALGRCPCRVRRGSENAERF